MWTNKELDGSLRRESTTHKTGPGRLPGGKVCVDEIDHLLNRLGAEGWELTSVFETGVTFGTSRHVVLALPPCGCDPPGVSVTMGAGGWCLSVFAAGKSLSSTLH